MPHILGLCGSLRAASFNRKLMRAAAHLYGADLIEADLRLPLYDGDLEAGGLPPGVETLGRQIAAAPAVVIATPEYNQRTSAVLKNALDWVSRLPDNPWKHKPVALMSAAAGRTGGARAQYDLRLTMVPYRVNVIPGPEVMVAAAHQQFDESGALMAQSYLTPLGELMEQLRAAAATRAATS